ncbi:MAG: spore coat associated protein CotJA [Oscillospiraceae bacterium]|nr:spore coat associated protein CotJA [Oscillospiraceae bacterium]
MSTQKNQQWEQPMDDMDCTRMDRSPLPKDPVVAMAYVPFQQFNNKNLYGAEEGFGRGTLFPDLDKPFSGWPGDRG